MPARTSRSFRSMFLRIWGRLAGVPALVAVVTGIIAMSEGDRAAKFSRAGIDTEGGSPRWTWSERR